MPRPETTGRKSANRSSVPLAAYSIRGFCEAHGISIDLYFRLQREGGGPRTFKAGARTLISVEAAADWRRVREEAAAQPAE